MISEAKWISLLEFTYTNSKENTLKMHHSFQTYLSHDYAQCYFLIVFSRWIKVLIMIDKIGNSKCPGDLEVCCKISEQIKESSTSIPNPTTGSILLFPPNENFTSQCGRHNVEGIDIRIVDSVEGSGTAQVGEWPHTCILFYR